MKKTIICVVLLGIMLTACGKATEPTQLNSSVATTAPTTVPTKQQTTVPTTEPTMALTTSVRPSSYPTTSPPVPTTYFYADSYTEYCKFIADQPIADHIILLEQLPYLGEFDTMKFAKNPDSEKEINYSYNVTTATGDRLSILFLPLVDYEQRYLYPDKTDISEFAKDCLLITDAETTSGYARKDDVVYHYHLGKLTSFYWAYEGYVIGIDTPENWCDDIENVKKEPVFIQLLLHADTVETAMQTFKDSMEAAAVK